jgi:hypothetical protein
MADFMRWLHYKLKVRRLAKEWLAGDAGARQKIQEDSDFRNEFVQDDHPDHEAVHSTAGGGRIRWLLREYKKRRAVFEFLAIEDQYWRDVEARGRRENAMWDFDFEARPDVIRRAKSEWEATKGATHRQVAAKYGMTERELAREFVILILRSLVHCKPNLGTHC